MDDASVEVGQLAEDAWGHVDVDITEPVVAAGTEVDDLGVDRLALVADRHRLSTVFLEGHWHRHDHVRVLGMATTAEG